MRNLAASDTLAEMATKRQGKHPGGRPRKVQDPERVAVDLERPDLDALRALAAEREVSVADLVRLAVSRLLRQTRRRG